MHLYVELWNAQVNARGEILPPQEALGDMVQLQRKLA